MAQLHPTFTGWSHDYAELSDGDVGDPIDYCDPDNKVTTGHVFVPASFVSADSEYVGIKPMCGCSCNCGSAMGLDLGSISWAYDDGLDAHEVEYSNLVFSDLICNETDWHLGGSDLKYVAWWGWGSVANGCEMDLYVLFGDSKEEGLNGGKIGPRAIVGRSLYSTLDDATPFNNESFYDGDFLAPNPIGQWDDGVTPDETLITTTFNRGKMAIGDFTLHGVGFPETISLYRNGASWVDDEGTGVVAGVPEA